MMKLEVGQVKQGLPPGFMHPLNARRDLIWRIQSVVNRQEDCF